MLALLIAMMLANTHIVPFDSPAYDFVRGWLMPMAIPLLLFRANIRETIRSSGRMFLVLHISSVRTLLAFWLLHGQIGMPDSAHASG